MAVLCLRCCAWAFLVAVSGGYSLLQCAGFSLSWLLLLWSTGSTRTGSVAVAHGPSCSVACGIFPDQGSNPCPLHWQADSQPLRHQGSPTITSFKWLCHCSDNHLFFFSLGIKTLPTLKYSKQVCNKEQYLNISSSDKNIIIYLTLHRDYHFEHTWTVHQVILLCISMWNERNEKVISFRTLVCYM